MAAPAKVTPTYEAIMDWMIMNPGRPMKELADAFGYSQAWLSSIINSSCFQARMAEKRGEITALVALDLPQKISSAAHMAVDRMTEHMERNPDPQFALEVAKLTFPALGYGAKHGGITINQQGATVQQVFATPAELAEARALMAAPSSLPAPVPDSGHLTFIAEGELCVVREP